MRQVFWRILLFYVMAILVIGLLIPYTDPQLLRTEVTDVSVSPFALIFERASLAAASVMNAVVLTSVLSAGNSGMYAATRMLYSLARDGKAPAVFGRVTATACRWRWWPRPWSRRCASSASSSAPRPSTSGC